MATKPYNEADFRADLTTAARTVVQMATGSMAPCPVRFAAAQDVLDRLEVRGAEFIRLLAGKSATYTPWDGQSDGT